MSESAGLCLILHRSDHEAKPPDSKKAAEKLRNHHGLCESPPGTAVCHLLHRLNACRATGRSTSRERSLCPPGPDTASSP
jgi:hypothetical protein